MNHPALYRKMLKAGRAMQRLHPIVKGSKIDPLYPWTKTRDFPQVAPRSFKDYWSSR